METGKVRFATRDLPLPFHAFALPAAIAARCAGQQGKFWEYREALFRDQAQLATDPHAGLAQSLGLDAAQFADCRRDPAMAHSVQADVALARASNIQSTPTFVIGRVVDTGSFDGEGRCLARSPSRRFRRASTHCCSRPGSRPATAAPASTHPSGQCARSSASHAATAISTA